MPAINKSESPGKAKPINNPVSANRIDRIPITPRSVTIEWASNKFILGSGYLPKMGKMSVIYPRHTSLFVKRALGMRKLARRQSSAHR
jgi:hypothetical protein